MQIMGMTADISISSTCVKPSRNVVSDASLWCLLIHICRRQVSVLRSLRCQPLLLVETHLLKAGLSPQESQMPVSATFVESGSLCPLESPRHSFLPHSLKAGLPLLLCLRNQSQSLIKAHSLKAGLSFLYSLT